MPTSWTYAESQDSQPSGELAEELGDSSDDEEAPEQYVGGDASPDDGHEDAAWISPDPGNTVVLKQGSNIATWPVVNFDIAEEMAKMRDTTAAQREAARTLPVGLRDGLPIAGVGIVDLAQLLAMMYPSDMSADVEKPRATKLGGFPNLSFIYRKPKPLAAEMKIVCDCDTGNPGKQCSAALAELRRPVKRGSAPGVLAGVTTRGALLRFCAGTNVVRGKAISVMEVEECWAQCVAMMPPGEEPPPVYSFLPKNGAAQLLADYIRCYTGCSDIVAEDVCGNSSADNGDSALFFLPKDMRYNGGYATTKRFEQILGGKPWPPVAPETDEHNRLKPILSAPHRLRTDYNYTRPRGWRSLFAKYHGAKAAAASPDPPAVPRRKRGLPQARVTNTDRLDKVAQLGAPRKPARRMPAQVASREVQRAPRAMYRPGVHLMMDALVEAAERASQKQQQLADAEESRARGGGDERSLVHLPVGLLPSNLAAVFAEDQHARGSSSGVPQRACCGA
eukprot:jgi/Tetstr1/455897/TSEL_004081.t1